MPRILFGSVLVSQLFATIYARLLHINVKTDCGAVGDGITNDTAAVQTCLAAASKLPGGTLTFPSGTYLCEPLQLTNTTDFVLSFQEGATILAVQRDQWPSVWPYGGTFFSISSSTNLTVVGWDQFTAIVDGQGADWWAAFHANVSIDRPFLVEFSHITGLTLSTFQLRDSPCFHAVFNHCTDVLVDRVSIQSPNATIAPNTDGFDPGNSNNLTFRGLHIVNGDDCVAVKPGTANVLIEDSYCENGHGFSIGSLGEDGATSTAENVTVRNCVLNGTLGAAKVKAWQGGGGYARNISYANITVIATIDDPIQVSQFYCPGNPSKCALQPGGVNISGFTVDGVTGTFAHGAPARFNCTAAMPCTGISLANVHISPAPGNSAPNVMKCVNAYGQAENGTVSPPSCLLPGPADGWT